MRRARQFAFPVLVLLLFCICLPLSASSAVQPYYTAIAVNNEKDGVLTLENGDTWYRVREFQDDADYILTVKDNAGAQKILAVSNGESSRYIWNYYRYSMTTSTAPRIALLSASGCVLSVSGGRLMTYFTGSGDDDRAWSHEDTALCFRGSEGVWYLKYDAAADEPFAVTADRSEAAEVIVYSRYATRARCIVRQPAAASYVIEGSGYPAPVFSVGLPDVTLDSIRWFADGEEQHCRSTEFTAECLTDRPAGIHSVRCIVEAHDSDGVHYKEQSADAAFVIAKGVVPDSIMTFSDVHEEYGLITDAIGTVMQQTGGYIPSLVICSGDFVNGPTAEKDTELNRYFPQMISHLGGLDAVFVAGNHDSAEAASVMTSAAGLGAAAQLPAEGGLIFCGESDAVSQHGRNSRAAKGIVAYGINFDAALQKTDGGFYYTYENVIRSVDSFLKKTAGQYHGELVVISAHSGMHVIGQQPESVNMYSELYPWQGENAYNIDLSYELAQTINRYAEQYDMDILYLFGHDHSRGETELFLTDGDTLIGSHYYADRSCDALTLHFTYAHAGYLSSVIGSAVKQFSFIFRNGDSFSYDLLRSEGGVVRHEEFRAKHPYEEPAPAQTEAVSETETTQTTAQSAASGTKAAGADAGDEMPALTIALPALAVLLLSRKRRGHDAAAG